MILYILKSSACLATFFLFYKLFLEKENMHVFKRFYLLIALIAAFIIPLMTFTSYVYTAPLEGFSNVAANDSFSGILAEENRTIYLANFLWTIYGLGVFLFGIKFIHNIRNLLIKIKRNDKVKENFITNVLLTDMTIPHTFFMYIFLNKYKFETKQIPEEVMAHEQAHAFQKHSLDVLFVEIVQVIFWFNPFIYVMKHAMKLNHEFLADQSVLNRGFHPSNYQKTLLNYTSNDKQISLANAINYSFIKKRFTLMKTQTSKRAIWLRSLVLLPLLAVLIYGFSEKTIIVQDKATKEEVKEYNSLAKKYHEMDPSHMTLKLKEITRLTHIYNKMTATQKKTAEAFPNFPPPPPPVSEVMEAPMPPPPPLPKNASAAQKENYQKNLETYRRNQKKNLNTYKTKNGVLVEIIEDAPPPPPPPLPPNPLDHIIELAKEGATFYYDDKKISSDKAIEIVKKNRSIHIQVRDHDSKNPIVKLSKKPIVVKKY